MRRKGLDIHGICPSEAAVMDRYDAGMSHTQIVAETGYSMKRVKQIISWLDVSSDIECAKLRAGIVAGSQMLGEATLAFLQRTDARTHPNPSLGREGLSK